MVVAVYLENFYLSVGGLVLSAASISNKEQIAEIILIGKEDEVLSLAKEDNIDLATQLLLGKTSDGNEKLAISVNEKKKYSQLIADEFFKNVNEN